MVSPCTSLLCYKIDHVHTMTHDTVELKKEGNWFLHTRLPCPLTAQAESWMCNEKNTATSKDKKNIYSRGWRKWQKNIATVFFYSQYFFIFAGNPSVQPMTFAWEKPSLLWPQWPCTCLALAQAYGILIYRWGLNAVIYCTRIEGLGILLTLWALSWVTILQVYNIIRENDEAVGCGRAFFRQIRVVQATERLCHEQSK